MEISQNRSELEFSVIGAMIHDREIAGQILPVITRRSFSLESIGTVFEAVKGLFNADKPIDRLSVLQLCGDDYRDIVEAALIHRAAPSNAVYYAELLRERARLSAISTAAMDLATLPETADRDTVTELLNRLNALSVTRSQWKSTSMRDAVHGFFDRRSEKKKPEFLDFGLPGLNRKLFCEPGDFIVLAGEPSSGKTALAAQMTFSLAKKHRVGFFTLETSPDKLTDRMMANAAGVSLRHIKENTLDDIEWQKLYNAAEQLSDVTIEQVAASGMTVQDIRSYSLAHRYDVIIIDYIQIIRPANPRVSRYEQVTQISMDLHTTAQENRIAILALAQLSRPVKASQNKSNPDPPSMHDLKESGQIEQDADAVLLLYNKDRNSYTCPRMLKIGKNKEGERDIYELAFSGPTQRFEESEESDDTHIRPKHSRPYKEADDKPVFRNVTFDELGDEEPLPF